MKTFLISAVALYICFCIGAFLYGYENQKNEDVTFHYTLTEEEYQANIDSGIWKEMR